MSDSRVGRDEDHDQGLKQAPDNVQDTPGAADGTGGQRTPGEMLRDARHAMDYSLEDLCSYTMLSRNTIKALEENRFDQLSQPVFARGYYRKCARVLNMDVDELLKAYVAAGGAKTATVSLKDTPVTVVPADVTPDRRRSFGVIFLIVILILAAFAGYLYWQGNMAPSNDGSTSVGISLDNLFGERDAATDKATDQADDNAVELPNMAEGRDAAAHDIGDQVTPQADEDEAIPTPDNSPEHDDTSGLTPDDSVAQVPSSDMTPDDGVTGQNRAESSAAADSGTSITGGQPAEQTSEPASEPTDAAAESTALTLRFTDRSWVNIRDADGRQLLVGIYADTTRILDGTPPYSLVIGYAPGVHVEFLGQAIDYHVAADNTARFTVGKH